VNAGDVLHLRLQEATMLVSRRLTRALAGALAVAALAAPSAAARPALEPGDRPASGSSQAIELQSDSGVPVVTRSTDTGFDWGSAAVGAGGAAAVLLLIGAGSSQVLHRPRGAGTVH
jgi:hypothetical protein